MAGSRSRSTTRASWAHSSRPTLPASRQAAERWGARAIVVDIPIGIPESGPRLADTEARRFIKPRGSSVFPTPVRAALEAPTYEEARIASVAASGKSLSSQAFAIAPRILDVDGHTPRDGVAIIEGHPEVSFRAMAGEPITERKKDLGGAILRTQLLEAEGMVVPRAEREALKPAALDDVLDAAAMAWTARRIERGEA